VKLRTDRQTDRAVLRYLGALGPPGWWGPYHPYSPRGGVGAVVLCTCESDNILSCLTALYLLH